MWAVVALTRYNDLSSMKVFGIFQTKYDADHWIATTNKLDDCFWTATKEITVWE